jgi:hypothetical protein
MTTIATAATDGHTDPRTTTTTLTVLDQGYTLHPPPGDHRPDDVFPLRASPSVFSPRWCLELWRRSPTWNESQAAARRETEISFQRQTWAWVRNCQKGNRVATTHSVQVFLFSPLP